MFSPEFRERLRLGKYSHWAMNLTEAQLEAVIWMVGEYGYRARHVLPLLTHLWREEGSGRAVLALESLFRVVGGDRPDRETSSQRARDFLAEVRGYAEDAGGPPAHNWPVHWQGRVVGWLVAPTLGEHGCSCSGVWWPAATGAVDFLAVLSQPSPDGVRVVVGGIPAWVKSPPDQTGRMELWIYISPHASELRAPPDADQGVRADAHHLCEPEGTGPLPTELDRDESS
jgi:hypothetical protein